MKFSTVVLLFLIHFSIHGQNLLIGSWNIQDMGGTKDDDEVEQMAELLRDLDIVAIQEVVAVDQGRKQNIEFKLYIGRSKKVICNVFF